MKKSIIYFIILGIYISLIVSCISVSAETENDPQNDVWHFVYPYWQSQTVSNQPNIDIKEIKAEISGNQMTLSMSIWPGGTFSRSNNDYAAYIMFYNTSDAYYMMSYSDFVGENPIGSAIGISLTGEYIPSTGYVTINDNMMSATLDKVGEDTTTVEIYGTAWMYESYGAEQYLRDSWHDWVGDYDWDPDIDPEQEEPEEEEPEEEESEDKTELEGTWKGTEPNGQSGTWTWIFDGNELDIIGPIETYQGTFMLNTSKIPKTIDYNISSTTLGEDYEKMSLGIYQITGNSLKIVMHVPGDTERPTTFNDVRYYELSKSDAGKTNGDSDTSTPGFELILLIASIGILFIYKKIK